jgi:hypothetical protein
VDASRARVYVHGHPHLPMPSPDYFSDGAEAYRSFRPSYPPELFAFLATLCRRHERAWECGAGSGQATAGLEERFEQVIATDASLAQLSLAAPHRAVRVVCAAEAAPLPSDSVDVVAAAQALHWFRHDAFFAEVRRVAREGAILAAWTYHLPTIEQRLDARLRTFALAEIGTFWPPGRAHVDAAYASIPFPFPEIISPAFDTTRSWSGDDVLGYVATWSATRRARAALPHDPMETLERDWKRLWGPLQERRVVRWRLTLRAFRIGERPPA